MGRVCVRGCRAEVGEEGFFFRGVGRGGGGAGRGLERVWWCLDWGSRGVWRWGEGRRFWECWRRCCCGG